MASATHDAYHWTEWARHCAQNGALALPLPSSRNLAVPVTNPATERPEWLKTEPTAVHARSDHGDNNCVSGRFVKVQRLIRRNKQPQLLKPVQILLVIVQARHQTTTARFEEESIGEHGGLAIGDVMLGTECRQHGNEREQKHHPRSQDAADSFGRGIRTVPLQKCEHLHNPDERHQVHGWQYPYQ